MRIVVDTNVFINGIFKKDTFCKAIFNLKSLNKVSFVIKRIDKSQKFNIFPLMATLSKCLWQVEEIDHIINTNYCIDDKSDNKFIDCCIDGNVTYLITQDQHINNAS